MKYKLAAVSLLAAAALVATPVSPAMADPFHHHGGHGGNGLLFGLIGAGAAVTIAAATLATAPVRILADAADAPPAVAVAPAPAYYAPQPAYYAAPAPVAVYASYPAYRYPQPVYGYYGGYYGRRYY